MRSAEAAAQFNGIGAGPWLIGIQSAADPTERPERFGRCNMLVSPVHNEKLARSRAVRVFIGVGNDRPERIDGSA